MEERVTCLVTNWFADFIVHVIHFARDLFVFVYNEVHKYLQLKYIIQARGIISYEVICCRSTSITVGGLA